MFEQYTMLYITEVGSRMWNMATPTSDSDREYVYIAPTRDILSGRYRDEGVKSTKFVDHGVPVDAQIKEVGHVVNLLRKGNITSIWTVTTPNILQDSPALRRLRETTLANLSKLMYPSMHGYIMAMIKDAERQVNPAAIRKLRRSAYRIAQQGTTLFRDEQLVYCPAPAEVTIPMLQDAVMEFGFAYQATKLPDTGDVDAFHDLLYDLRLAA